MMNNHDARYAEYQVALAKVKEKWSALRYVSHNVVNYEEICLAAIEQDNEALKLVAKEKLSAKLLLDAMKINGKALKHVPLERLTEEIFIAALSQNGGALSSIPLEMLTEKHCLIAVGQNGLVLESVPLAFRNEKVCRAAVKKQGEALEFVPIELRNAELCLDAVTQEGNAYEFVPKAVDNHTIRLAAVTQNGYALDLISKKNRIAELCLVAVKQKGKALESVPKNMRTSECCMEAVKQDGNALEFVPESVEDYENIRTVALQQTGAALRHIPMEKRSLKMCVDSVMQNSLFLEYVPDDLKKIVIETITPEKILADNYAAHQYFPEGFDYDDHFLSGIKHIIVTKNNATIKDHELKDISLVYANSPKRQNKILVTNNNDVEFLLERLEKNQAQNINLVLLDHANEKSEKIAAMDAKSVSNLLSQHPIIDRITLLGCNTAKSEKLDTEIEMIRRFSHSNHTAGLILMSSIPAKEQFSTLLKFANLDEVYVLINPLHGKEHHQLLHLSKDGENLINDNMITLDNDAIKNLQNTFIRGKKFSFPKSENEKKIMRDSEHTLSLKEQEKILETFFKTEKFDREHPEYKQDKKKYPYLSSVTIDKQEENKLKESLLKKMSAVIRNNPEITWDIEIKGYTKSVHADLIKNRLQGSRSYLYTSQYKKSKSTFFHSKKENIERKKLAEERNILNKELEKKNESGDTTVKAIKVRIKK